MIRRILPGDAYYAPVEGGVVRTVAESPGFAIKAGDAEVFVPDRALEIARLARVVDGFTGALKTPSDPVEDNGL